MSTLLARKLAHAPAWVPRSGSTRATEHADFQAGRYWSRRRAAPLQDFLARAGWSFSRATPASRLNGSGRLEFVAAGTPRLDHDAAAAPLGLLIEGERTNLAIQSEAFDNGWNIASAGVTIAADAATGPDGATTADKVIEAATSNTHAVYRGIAFAATPYTFTVHAKSGERIWAGPYHFDNGTERFSWFNLDTGAISASGAGVKRIAAAPDGYWRLAHTRTPVAGSGRYGFKVSSGQNVGSYAGDGTSGTFAFGIQVEQAPFESSYFPTAAATATRAADSLTRTIAQPAAIAATFQVRTPAGASGTQTIWSIGDATDGMRLLRDNTGQVRLVVTAAGAETANLSNGGIGNLGVHRIAISHDGTTAKLCLNGGELAEAACAIPTLSTLTERIGASSIAGEEWFGHIQNYALFAGLADGELIAKTAATVINVLSGIDSLSNPQSTGYNAALTALLEAAHGGPAGTGWITLTTDRAYEWTSQFWSGGSTISFDSSAGSVSFSGEGNAAGYAGHLTFDGQGHVWNSAANGVLSVQPKDPFDVINLAYVQYPGGGTFSWSVGGASQGSVDTDGGNELKILHKEAFAAPNGLIGSSSINGTVAILGMMGRVAGKSGVIFSGLGSGGKRVQHWSLIEQAVIAQYASALRPTHFLFNGGMNDRTHSDATQFEADCRHLIDGILAGWPSCRVVMIQPHDPGDAATSHFDAHKPVRLALAAEYGFQFVDVRDAHPDLASYALASAAGFIPDGIHLTQVVNQTIVAPFLFDAVRW